MDEVSQTNLGDFSTESAIAPNEVEDIGVSSLPPREINMPSIKKVQGVEEKIDHLYHDLNILYPNPPIPDESQGVVIRRAKLAGISGISNVLNWVSENSAVVVNLDKIMSRENDLSVTLNLFTTFVEKDMGGQILQLTKSKVLLLPPECQGITGIEEELIGQG